MAIVVFVFGVSEVEFMVFWCILLVTYVVAKNNPYPTSFAAWVTCKYFGSPYICSNPTPTKVRSMGTIRYI